MANEVVNVTFTDGSVLAAEGPKDIVFEDQSFIFFTDDGEERIDYLFPNSSIKYVAIKEQK